MAKIGVTGALGYLGSKVCLELKERGFEVVPVDNLSNNKVEGIPDLQVREKDISSLENLKEVFPDVDAIVHLAASSGLEACTERSEEAFRNNVLATSNIAWFCRQNEIPLSFASSVAVFGTPDKFPITEQTPKNPQNFYGETKLMGEEDIQRLSRESFRSHIFNIANICEAHEVDSERVARSNVVELFLQEAIEGEDMTVYKPGTQSRDFISVNDVAGAFALSVEELLSSEVKGAERYLLATGRSTGILTLAEKISETVEERGIESDATLVENPRESEVVAEEFEIDSKKIERELGFSPKESLEKIISGSL